MYYRHLIVALLLLTSYIYPMSPPIVADVTDIVRTYNNARTQLNAMSLRDKIAQLFVVPATSNPSLCESEREKIKNSPYRMDQEYVESLITKYHVGGIIWLCRSTPAKQAKLTHYYQSLSNQGLLIAQDVEWGLTMRLDGCTRFPKAMTLGALSDSDDYLITQVAEHIGTQCRRLGVHMALGPVVDVNTNPSNPVIGMRSFGSDPEHVAKKAALFAEGLKKAGMLACAKHFPGHGDTSQDSHYELPHIQRSLQELEKTEMVPFKQQIEKQRVPAIMMAHLQVSALDNDNPTSLSPQAVQYLKEQLGFKGLVITDGLGMYAVNKGKPGEVELRAFLAGNDILLCPVHVPEAIDLIEKAVTSGQVTHHDLDQRVLKVLHLKEILKYKKQLYVPPAVTHEDMNNGQELKKRAFQQAVTIIKNNGILPLKLNQSFSPVVIRVFSDSSNERITNTQKVRDDIKKCKDEGHSVIAALFCSPYDIACAQAADAIIMGYEDDPDAQEAVAECIATGVAPGRLPITLECFN